MRKRNNSAVTALLAEITPAQKLRTRTKMALAARIEDLIKINGWSKSEFAAKLSKQPSEVTKWLSGTHNFTVDTMADMAAVFNLTVEQLLQSKPVATVRESHFLVLLTGTTQSIKYITPTPSVNSGSNIQALGLSTCISD